MNRIGIAFRHFGGALALLQYGRPIVPLALYFLLKVAFIAAYAWGETGPLAGAWRLLRPGAGAEALAHYPDRLLFMPIVLGRLDLALEVLALALAQGATVLLVAAGARRERMNVAASFRASGRRYLHLVVTAAIASAVIFACFRWPAALVDRLVGMPRGPQALLSVALAILAQTLFAYAVALVVLEGRSGIGAARASAALAIRRPVESIAFVLVPFLLTVPTLLLSLNPQAVAFQISPEFLVQVQVAGELVELVTGYLMIGGIALFVLETRARENTR